MDPGALQRKALEVAEQAGRNAGAGDGIPSSAGESDVARFHAVLDQSPLRDAVPPEPVVEGVPASPLQGAGDRVLQGMRSVSEAVQAGRKEVADIMMKESVTQADLLRANFSMMESSALVSGISKTTEKITQGLKTLQQG
jgi:hypothetical protein